ncbi:MAG TPA: alpha/beta hydrolase-fold protein [Salinimicrobium sp.]|nr:alpha/beta hydrolase-fold protein [Salinimicrobium sp.]
MVKKLNNIALKGKHGRPVVTDVFYQEEKKKCPIIIFCHGYKGFKDWGTWNLMAEAFVEKGFLFVKFNFSFNGGTAEQPIDFPDLQAFGENTFTKELDDLEVLLDWICGPEFPVSDIADTENISLMGHSRGGGTAVIKASEDTRIKQLITLASVSDFNARFPKGEELEAWKKNRIGYIENTRTGQKMPHLYSFYENFIENQERLTISSAAGELKIPFLIIHGTEDPTVDVSNAEDLKRWNPKAELFLLKGSNHVFEGQHPWEEKNLPSAKEKIVEKVASFISDFSANGSFD